jgi:hypothetical protein
MQTFLPSKDFDTCANMLDSKRLNKQILEGYQILKVMSNPDPRAAWRNHPAVVMWRGHEMILHSYVQSMIKEADKRGIKTDKNKFNIAQLDKRFWGRSYPKWYQNTETMTKVVATHRANLYRKDPEFYFAFEVYDTSSDSTPCCEKCQYFWPSHLERRLQNA